MWKFPYDFLSTGTTFRFCRKRNKSNAHPKLYVGERREPIAQRKRGVDRRYAFAMLHHFTHWYNYSCGDVAKQLASILHTSRLGALPTPLNAASTIVVCLSTTTCTQYLQIGTEEDWGVR